MRNVGWALALCVVAWAGCTPAKEPGSLANIRFEPYTARRAPDRSAEWAAVAYKGDVEALAAAGGRPLGTLVLTGNPGVDDAGLDAQAKKMAAEAGGTHVVPSARLEISRTEVDEDATAASAVFAGLKGAGDQMKCQGGDLYSCFRETPQARTFYRTENLRVAGYLVVAVAPERWGDLPAELRPEAVRPRSPAVTKAYHWVQKVQVGRPPEWQYVPVDE